MEHSSENMEHMSAYEQPSEEKEPYTPRPKGHLVLAWALIAVVLFAFFGTCYWMVTFGRG